MTGMIEPRHLRRAAYVYVRQSTPSQVAEHRESLERQYELRDRAVALGWRASEVVVIDEDLGRSGARVDGREGFQRLVADVGLGKVGIVLGIEVSRLARNNADWYQLLDLCALCDTLIADADGIYHPGLHNDRLVLGLKGTMSEAELHTIRQRLQGGLLHKAAKGQLRLLLPVGYDHDEDGSVVITPDEAVVAVIAEVFGAFDQLTSVRQVMVALIERGQRLPRRRPGQRRVNWVAPTYGAVHDLLTNPCYAGVYAYGRTRTQRRVVEGHVQAFTRETPHDEWIVCIRDHHAGFITFERYLENRARIRANRSVPRDAVSGVAREGSALLQGLVRCGRCGRKMQVSYSGHGGGSPRFQCVRARDLHGVGSACQTFGARRVERTVVDAVLEAMRPAAVDATLLAIERAEADHAQQVNVAGIDLERCRYEADRARRQFDACEPENRLVARTLESGWDERLADVRRAEAELIRRRTHRPQPLSAEEIVWCRRAGADLRCVFEAPQTTDRERKQLMRAVLQEVVVSVDRSTRTAALRLVWEGGAVTEHGCVLNPTGRHRYVTDAETIDLVRRLAARYDDPQVAQILSRSGRRTAKGMTFTAQRVRGIRLRNQIPVRPVTPPCDDGDLVSVAEAGESLGVSTSTVHRWLREGFIGGEQLAPGMPWRIRISDDLRASVADGAPEGWLGLDDAARALGVARQTVLHRVQSGKLRAVRVRIGRRSGLRIQVERQESGLIEMIDTEGGHC